MPLVERRAAAAASFPSTAPSGPIFLHPIPTTMLAKTTSYISSTASSSSISMSSPASPHAVSATMAAKPPISPPQQVLPGMPALMRLPSLVTRTNQALHIRPPPTPQPTAPVAPTLHAHRPSVVPPSPSQPTGTDGPSPRELAARLALLLHARECCTPLDVERVCGVRNCRVARGVLDHCQECFLPEGQCHRSCSEAKQLLRHFRVCRAQQFQRACAICDLLRGEFAWAMHHARSLTPLFVPRASAAEAQDDVFLRQPVPAAPYAATGEPQRRHSSHHPEAYVPGTAAATATALRRSVSEGPHATMSATGHHHKRSAVASVAAAMAPHHEPSRAAPSAKRVRIVTPTEEAEAARAKKAAA